MPCFEFLGKGGLVQLIKGENPNKIPKKGRALESHRECDRMPEKFSDEDGSPLIRSK